MKRNIGIIGLGTMGSNLALNISNKGIPIAVYNRTYNKTQEFIQGPALGKDISFSQDLKGFVDSLEAPRQIILMIKAGGAVDTILTKLVELLEPGDIIIDGGNSHSKDTDYRSSWVEAYELKYLGMGISGGEEGALNGPSLMPGGNKEAYKVIEPVLKQIAANHGGVPCVDYLGEKGAGHFVKTVHNGIEYGYMQLIAEVYHLLYALGFTMSEVLVAFKHINLDKHTNSYLLDVTLDVLKEKHNNDYLIGSILDKAGQKGTGSWTVSSALELGVPVPTIYAGLNARVVSSYKEDRVKLSKYDNPPNKTFSMVESVIVEDLKSVLLYAQICCYVQGLNLIKRALPDLDLLKVINTWKDGCIIRSGVLEILESAIYAEPDLENLLLSDVISSLLSEYHKKAAGLINLYNSADVPCPGFSSALNYFSSFTKERLPQNLTQAQRDYFGAHTYQLIGSEDWVHTKWGQK